jgi:hypothetical protein
MTTEQLFMVVVGLSIAVGGWFFKRIFKLLDDGASKMSTLEVDVAKLKTTSCETHARLDRIEEKLDRLLTCSARPRER